MNWSHDGDRGLHGEEDDEFPRETGRSSVGAGGTSLAGQTVNHSLAVDCSKHLNTILDLDVAGQRCRVQPGIVLDRLWNRVEQLALAQRYEEAASMRDRAHAFASAVQRQRLADRLRAAGDLVVRLHDTELRIVNGVLATVAAPGTLAIANRYLGASYYFMKRYAEAVAAYRDALAVNPQYPEAHFYMAVALEKLGRSAEARPHWRQYCELAPDGEFVQLAREFDSATS